MPIYEDEDDYDNHIIVVHDYHYLIKYSDMFGTLKMEPHGSDDE